MCILCVRGFTDFVRVVFHSFVKYMVDSVSYVVINGILGTLAANAFCFQVAFRTTDAATRSTYAMSNMADGVAIGNSYPHFKILEVTITA
jgi:hypothetical protein